MADFPVTPSTRVERYEMTGGETSLPLSWPVFGAGDIRVVRRRSGADVTLVLDTDYSVSGIGAATATVTLSLPALAGDLIAIVGAMPIRRLTDYIESGDFTARAMNQELDRIVMWSQEIERQIAQSVRFPDADGPQPPLEGVAARANKILAMTSAGTLTYIQMPSFSNTMTVSSVDEIRSYNFEEMKSSNESLIYIRAIGYYASTDGAGGVYVWDPSPWIPSEIIPGRLTPDDGGTRLVPTGQSSGPGLWRRVTAGRERLSLKCWGAKGDGVTDDSDAMEAAVRWGAVFVPQGEYLMTRRINVNGNTSIIGAHRTVSWIKMTNPDRYCFYGDSQNNVVISHIGFKNCTSAGLIVMDIAAGAPPESGANGWSLNNLWFTACRGPHIRVSGPYDMGWTDIDIFQPMSRNDRVVYPYTDSAVIFGNGVNNIAINGLRIEQPKYCGVFVAAKAEIYIQEGKIDCGFASGGSPEVCGMWIEGRLRLSAYLFSGFIGSPKIAIHGQGKVSADDGCTLGGGGGAVHVLIDGSYGVTGQTPEGIRPTGPAFSWAGSIERTHPDVSSSTPAIFDGKMSTPIKGVAQVAGKSGNSISFGTSLTTGTPWAKHHIAGRGNGLTRRSKINTYYNYGVNLYSTSEVSEYSIGDYVYVEYSPSHDLDITMGARIESNLPFFIQIANMTVLSASYSSGVTNIITSAVFPENEYTGRWVYTSSSSHKIIGSGGSAIQVPYDVASDFAVGDSITVRGGALFQTMLLGTAVVWSQGGALRSVDISALRAVGRGPRDVYPYRDGV
ncbi:glycosyl hydrolase family 28-related protein [Tistrella mobilis]|uniref:Tail fiber protein n=1 Tax=Tistrella mobilis (strain KA081020-065) TaxID=1110502 RepID=I3TGJ3_TISMK|nr:glycosyl hydrolase family 28-related protein [Tistrella mobilis]AFK51881.1 putative tail fiber protein [Tistrella mobilis KA081020-065]